ncbi:myocyte-specific enhancer factor 2, partial [Clonorchis sinensis]
MLKYSHVYLRHFFMGRKKIQIKKIADEKSCLVTFSKRKQGLFKKAYELSILCGCDIVLIVFTKADGLYQYASESIERVLERRRTHKSADKVLTNETMRKVPVDVVCRVHAILPAALHLKQRQKRNVSPSHHSDDTTDPSNGCLIIDEDYPFDANCANSHSTPIKRPCGGDSIMEKSPKRARSSGHSRDVKRADSIKERVSDKVERARCSGRTMLLSLPDSEGRKQKSGQPFTWQRGMEEITKNLGAVDVSFPDDAKQTGATSSEPPLAPPCAQYAVVVPIKSEPDSKGEGAYTLTCTTNQNIVSSTVFWRCSTPVPLNSAPAENPLSLLLLAQPMLNSSTTYLKSEQANMSSSTEAESLEAETPAVVAPDDGSLDNSGSHPTEAPSCSTAVSEMSPTKGEPAVSPTQVATPDIETSSVGTSEESRVSVPSAPPVDLDAGRMVKRRSRRRPTLSPLRVPTQQSRSTSTEYKPVPRGTFLDTPEVGTFLKNLEVSQCPLYGAGTDSSLVDPSCSYLSHLWSVSPLVTRSMLAITDPLDQASNYLRLNLTSANGGHLANIPMPKTPTGGLETPVVELPFLVH